MLRASGGCFYCSCESHHPRSSDESSRNCILMFGFKLSKLLHYLYVYVYVIQQVFKLETSHPPSQRTLFNLAQTPGNLATVWGGPYVNVFVVRNQHLKSSILVYYIVVGVSSRVAWARTSIHVQEYDTRHHHDIHLTPYYFLESMLEQSLQPRHFSNFSHRAAGEVGVCR